ncbi:MAG: metal-dependent hydrolase [Oculatellaceae cyanobacterium Prado106]|jgi:hypothetical protein|nr:metal-dependent hydrolase [Oculatellaceae cyanobacterium Prado106]
MSQITVRHKQFTFPPETDRHWLGNSPFRTHFFNSFTLLFPEGEQLAIRYFKKVLSQIHRPKLHEEVVAFIGQEGQHAAAHGQFWSTLRQQGYQLDRYATIQQVFISKKQRFSTGFYLATIAGFEHFTDCLAELVLESRLLAAAPAPLQELFEWHFAEELEHKTVAYDVFQQLDHRYPMRILGLINAHFAILGAVILGLITLLGQDRQLFKLKTIQDAVQFLFLQEKFCWKALTNFVTYLRFDFHPAQKDSSALSQKILGRVNS